jgi:hypothetical protein
MGVLVYRVVVGKKRMRDPEKKEEFWGEVIVTGRKEHLVGQ